MTLSAPDQIFSTLRWPLAALLAWIGAWLAFVGIDRLGPHGAVALALASVLPLGIAWRVAGRWRRCIVMAGFPVSAAALGAAASLPAWAWLVPLAALVLVYPVQAWRDAPFFPTPQHALRGLATALAIPGVPRLLDAGCGLGHGLRALRREWPDATCAGLERSLPLAWLTRARCRWARVWRADMWAASWADHDLVYLFQRPESMARAWRKADAELAPGSWLVSLEFPVPGVAPSQVLCAPGQRVVWAYRIGAVGLARYSGSIKVPLRR